MTLSVIIPSKSASNLSKCLQSVVQYEPSANIIVVDDGVDWDKVDVSSEITVVPGVHPFIFSRNVNIGIEEAGNDDVVILNDDALLQTPGGFSLLQKEAQEHPEYGVIAATTNNVGNLNQLNKGIGLREDPRMVCFVAVLIPRRTIEKVGLLDERFIGYGGEDNAYCKEVRKAGLKIGIHDGCFVDHKHLPSTFRGFGSGDISQGHRIYKEIYREDYNGNPA